MFDWLKDREYITFLIAVIGFAMSIYNFVVNILQNRVSLKTEFPNVFRIETNGRTLDVIHVKILNLSSRPIVLHHVSVSNNLNSESFGSRRRELVRIEKRKGNEPAEKQYWFSDNLPVEIGGNGYVNLLLMADSDSRVFVDETMHTIQLHTARRVIRRKHFVSTFSNLRQLSECREPN